MEAITPQLTSHWESLLQPFHIRQSLSQKVLVDLVSAYSDAGRFYHTLQHIQQVLATINELRRTLSILSLRTLSPDYPTIKFAAWFHDVIYDPIAKDNEEKSAAYAAEVLRKMAIPPETINAVFCLILKTKKHQYPDNIEGKIFLDADLSILGAASYKYKIYTQAIRKEYAWVSDTEYRFRRKQVLQSFLQRERIYFTDQAFTALESRARQNIQEEIVFLSSGRDKIT